MVQISSLEAMEKVVSNNKQLSWDGWSVVHRYPNLTAWRHPDGVFIKEQGRWFTQKRYEPTSKGWDIPNKLVR
jgi:hypothetical protein